MREIKFRIWDSKSRGMFETFGDWYIDHEYGTFSILMELTYTDRENLILMQYAGLKDWNGMEIYEGDIVRSMRSGQIGYVFWGRGCYFVKWVKNTLIKEEYESYLWEVRTSIEVIGNQFEHPHLLEETK